MMEQLKPGRRRFLSSTGAAFAAFVDNRLRGISTSGEACPLARQREQTELAGACFSPDGRTLFVNVFSPTRTLAITGPWQHLS